MLRLTAIYLLTILFAHANVYADQRIDNVRENLTRILPANMEIVDIVESPMEGVFIATVGAQTMYIYSVGKFLMIGDDI